MKKICIIKPPQDVKGHDDKLGIISGVLYYIDELFKTTITARPFQDYSAKMNRRKTAAPST